jgi:hypothetical protein
MGEGGTGESGLYFAILNPVARKIKPGDKECQ